MQPPPTELSALDFTVGDANRALADCADMVEVQEVSAGIGAVYEEAAVLYANGSDAEAEQVLNAVLDDPVNTTGEGLWMMLLDLYRLTGQRQRFESRVLDYATRFERSPPPWHDLSAQVVKPKGSTVPMINLAGTLGQGSAAQLQQIDVIGRKSGAIRIDFGRLRGADAAGCALLREALVRLAANRVKVALQQSSQLATVLAGQVQTGRADNRDAWLLLLEALQYTGEHERFEELALDYAITFEESPPSWEDKAPKAPPAGAAPEPETEAEDKAGSGFRFEGELVGAANDTIRKLAAQAGENKKIVVDCSRLRRIDFVGAGTLFNVLSALQVQGRVVELKDVNAMVAALLRVMSVDQVARVSLRP